MHLEPQGVTVAHRWRSICCALLLVACLGQAEEATAHRISYGLSVSELLVPTGCYFLVGVVQQWTAQADATAPPTLPPNLQVRPAFACQASTPVIATIDLTPPTVLNLNAAWCFTTTLSWTSALSAAAAVELPAPDLLAQQWTIASSWYEPLAGAKYTGNQDLTYYSPSPPEGWECDERPVPILYQVLTGTPAGLYAVRLPFAAVGTTEKALVVLMARDLKLLAGAVKLAPGHEAFRWDATTFCPTAVYTPPPYPAPSR